MRKRTHYLFWIKSSRGTDSKAVYYWDKPLTKEEIKDRLEQWCSCHGAWDHSDNRITYGWRKIKMVPRREVMKQYDKACVRKEKANEEWSKLAQMLNPRKGF